MKKQVSFFCAVVGFLTATAFGQVLKVEPEKPKWGDKLKITYDPNAPGAAFTLDENPLALSVHLFREDGLGFRPKMAPMIKADKMLVCEVTVEVDFVGVRLTVVQQGKRDEKSRRMLMVYREDGQPVKGAHLPSAQENKGYQEWIDKELALYPDNYNAYRAKWAAVRKFDRPKLRAVIESDIDQVGTKVKGEPLDWLITLVYGHLWLGQEEKSRAVLRTMMAKYPDATQTGDAFFKYESESSAQHFTGAGPQEVNQMMLGLMKGNPASAVARRLAVRSLQDHNAQSWEVPEMVLRRWIADEPQNPRPYTQLAWALNEHGQNLEQVALLSNKALELMLQGKSQEYGLLSTWIEEMPELYYLNAKVAFQQGKYAQALSTIKAAQALNKETSADYLLLEGRIWEKAGMLAKAEPVYLTAWQRGSKDAAAALKSLYLQNGGAPDDFEKWLSKQGTETGAVTASNSAKKSFADFNFTTITGKKYELTALRGRIVVLNFWFISCGPCRAEMPELNKLVKEYKGRDVVFLAVTFDDSESVKAFQKEKTFDYEIIPDARAWIEKIGVNGFPTHYILNPQGEVELMLIDGSDKNLEQIRNVLARLTAGK